MNELFPIIRRKRRPLIVEESVPAGPSKPPVKVGNVEPACAEASADRPVQAVAAKPVEPATPEPPQPSSDAKPASTGNDD